MAMSKFRNHSPAALDLDKPLEPESEVLASGSPEEGLREARGQVLSAMPTIIGAIIEQAKTGSCQHAKFLMDFLSEETLQEEAEGEAEQEEESLASILLRELRENHAKQ
jgi:hypothetical protein